MYYKGPIDNISDYNKEVPYNLGVEQEILGTILNNNELLIQVSDFLSVDNFFVPIHQKIFHAINTLIDRGYVATPITINTYLEKDTAFKESNTNSHQYLLELVKNAQIINNLQSLGKTIHELYIRRQIIQICRD